MPKRMLIVDDNIDSIIFLPDILESYGYSATIVDSGYKAIELVKKTYYNVVLSDINMQGINGVEAFKKIKKISPTTVVIMMTAGASDEMIREAIEEGSFAVLYKPFEMNKLIDTITQAVKKIIILVVDDKLEHMEIVNDIFEQKGYKTVLVKSGEEALEIFRNGRADIAFIDIRMPGMDGFETLEKVKEVCPEICVLMMTAYHQKEYQQKSLKMGAFTCLYKPFDMEEVLKTVEEIREEKIKESALNILLIEDDVNLSKTLSGILKKEGYFVDCATDGKTAIDRNRKTFYNVIVVDYKLPDMTGIDVVKKIKRINPKTNIIFISGYATLDVAIEAIKEQVGDFLVKPVDPEKLIDRVRKLTR